MKHELMPHTNENVINDFWTLLWIIMKELAQKRDIQSKFSLIIWNNVDTYTRTQI